MKGSSPKSTRFSSLVYSEMQKKNVMSSYRYSEIKGKKSLIRVKYAEKTVFCDQTGNRLGRWDSTS